MENVIVIHVYNKSNKLFSALAREYLEMMMMMIIIIIIIIIIHLKPYIFMAWRLIN
jgi:hypothetical protein